MVSRLARLVKSQIRRRICRHSGTRGKISISAQIRREKLKKSFLGSFGSIICYCAIAIINEIWLATPAVMRTAAPLPNHKSQRPLTCAMKQVFSCHAEPPKESQVASPLRREAWTSFAVSKFSARCASQKCVPLTSNPRSKGTQKGTHLQSPRFKAHNAALCQTEIKNKSFRTGTVSKGLIDILLWRNGRDSNPRPPA